MVMKKLLPAFLIILAAVSVWCEEAQIPELEKIGTFSCGKQPKQVIFSPDGKYIVLPLLEDDGFDIFSVADKKLLKRINPPSSEKCGFAEGLFVPEKNAFFVSQMTTGSIYEYSYPGFNFKRTISTGGVWSKFITWDAANELIAVSNWVSDDVSFLRYSDGSLVKLVATAKAPRGLCFVNGNKDIISLAFDGGKIEKINTQSWKISGFVSIQNSAMRHIVTNKAQTTAYISDMYHRCVYEFDIKNFKIKRKTTVFNNPNTICLLSDRWLFVSSRGPNNKEDYTKRSPVNGKIQIIDTKTMQIVKTIEGGNQPTGLDISRDGTLLCFSNFQDANIELYRIRQ